ncbi:MAG: cation diffusion facilitator family transporter [Actinomycetaceae bacterium]|nr:cation diffusion facilitator family transporter [Actinomycetaceae bacterium]
MSHNVPLDNGNHTSDCETNLLHTQKDHSHNDSHGHEHNRGHHHGHGHHHHAPATRGRLAIALGVTFTIFIAEVVGALVANSLALLADAGHMLVDSCGLVIAVIAAYLMKKPRSDERTWGMMRAEVVAAMLQSGMLLLICIVVFYKAIERFFFPEHIHSHAMLWFGVIGLVGNLISLVVLLGGRNENLNMRAAFLEVANDALGSVAVITAAGLAWVSGWDGWDSVASLIIALMMGPRAWMLLRDSVRILMERTPDGLDLGQVREHILSVDHVIDVHDLHVTTIATGVISLTAHVTVEDECFHDGHSVLILHQIQDCVSKHFPVSIEHSTIQIDTETHRDHERLHH